MTSVLIQRYCLVAVVVLLYGLAFNPYVPPCNGDDITYFHGALSILEGNGFREQGKWIVDWPPVQSTIVAMVMWLTGNREYYVAKIVNGTAVLASLLLAHRILVSERRILPFLICVLIAIFPTSLLVGSAGQADFSYFAFSMLFLICLGQLRSSRRTSAALVCGLLLGVASLTRWQGVLLGTCLVFQACQSGASGKSRSVATLIRSVWPEVLASVLGASLFLGWNLWLKWCVASGMNAHGNYEYLGGSLWTVPSPLGFFTSLLNLLTQIENILLTFCPAQTWLLNVVVVGFIGLCMWGFVRRIREFGWLASDFYVVCAIGLLSTYTYKESRYVIPIAPFLLDYVLRGLCDVHLRIANRLNANTWCINRHRILFLAVWMSGLVAFDAIILFRGDGEIMGPSCALMLADNRDYLRGYHTDLYKVCKQLQNQYPGAIVASDRFHKQLIRYYSGLETHFVGYAPEAKFRVFIEVAPECLPKRADKMSRDELAFPPSLRGRISNPRRIGMVTLWDVDAEPSANADQPNTLDKE